jgi:hypothetical protein
MDLLNKLGMVSFVFTIIALILLVPKEPLSQVIFLISYSLQIYIFYKTKQWFLIFQMSILSFFAIFTYFKWTFGG